MKKIKISAKNVTVTAELFDTPTAQQIHSALPFEGSVNVWGDKIYFSIPSNLELEDNAREDVAVGDLGYWPAGPAFCIFFGPTPVSTGEQPRAASPVNVFGRVLGDTEQLRKISSGTTIKIAPVE